MSCGNKIGPFDCCSIVLGNCLELLPQLPDKCVDFVFADPPYGVDKAEWDGSYTQGYEVECLRVGVGCAFTPGVVNLGTCIINCGESYKAVLAARNMNGMTRSPIGFGSWIQVVICGKVSQGPDAFEFSVRGKMPNHPSPKPIEFMERLLLRFTKDNDIILDPFMGSGTTAVAAAMFKRHYLGFELLEQNVIMATKRVARIMDQPRLFSGDGN